MKRNNRIKNKQKEEDNICMDSKFGYNVIYFTYHNYV